MNRDFQQLRAIFDGIDPFMTGGHGKKKSRTRKKPIPEWAQSDKALVELLLRTFPKLQTNAIQRRRAGRWAAIIYLFFRLRWTRGWIAAELGMTPRNVRDTVRSIRRSAAGLRANGDRCADGKRVKLGSRRTGRPRTYQIIVFDEEMLRGKDL